MNKKTYYQLILIPPLLIILAIVLITFININSWYEHKSASIKQLTTQYQESNKKIVKDKVQYFIKNIELSKERNINEEKKRLKDKINFVFSTLKTHYNFHKNNMDKEIFKEEFIDKIKELNKNSQDLYIFIFEKKTDKVLAHNIKKEEKKLFKNHCSLFQTLSFKKTEQSNKEFEEIIYFKNFKPYNWIIGTTINKEDIEKKLQYDIAKKYNKIEKDNSNYLFAFRIDNINGGKDFGTMLIMPNKKYLIGKKISDNPIDITGKYYRKEYLKGLRENDELYLKYYYKKINSNQIAKKMTYFYLYKPWNWGIASGFYFDNLELQIKAEEDRINKKIEEKVSYAIITALIFIIIAITIFLIFTKNISTTIETFILKLDREKKNFKSIFYNSKDGLLLIKDGKSYDCNKKILDMFKFTSKKDFITNKTLFDISPEFQRNGQLSKNKLDKHIQKCISKGYVNFKWLHQKENGDIFDTKVTLSKITIDNGYMIYVVIRDISEKERLKKEAKEKDIMIIQQSKMASMGEMVGNIAHQWRQPLNALGLVIQKLELYYEQDTLDKENIIKIVDKSKIIINNMSSTINDFQNFFKIDKIKKEFILNDAISNIINIIEFNLTKNNIFLDIEENRDIKLLGYKNELEQVLLNIINNSKDALMNQKIRNKKINIEIKENNNNIEIYIIDNAGGISEDIINKIFEPYFTTKHQSQGTGIGLYMSKMIIEKNMNGSIFINNYKNGLKTTIIIPKG